MRNSSMWIVLAGLGLAAGVALRFSGLAVHHEVRPESNQGFVGHDVRDATTARHASAPDAGIIERSVALAAQTSPELQMGTTEGSGSPSPRDDTWASRRPSTQDLIPTIVFAPQLIDGPDVARNASFNPRDVYVTPDVRSAMQQAINRTRPEASRLGARLQVVRTEELADLDRLGLAIKVRVGRDSEINPVDAVGPGGFYQLALGSTEGIGARREQMPRSTAVSSELETVGRRLAAELADISYKAGALNAGELERVLARLSESEAELRQWRRN